jgi:fructose-1,6-bisphosphatase/inositol monophosphatase family enzyme
MSSKKIIEQIKSSLINGVQIFARDFGEIGNLQQSGIVTFGNFAIASYRKGFYKICSKIAQISPIYSIRYPKTVYAYLDGRLGAVKGDAILGGASGVVNLDYKPMSDEFIDVTVKPDKENPQPVIEKTRPNIGEFIINPLSSITNFARSLPIVSTSVAMRSYNENGSSIELSHAVVFDFITDLFYTASFNGGAFLNDTKIKVSPIEQLSKATIVIDGLERWLRGNPDAFKQPNTQSLMAKIKNLPFTVAQSLQLNNLELSICHLAAGKIDGVIALGIQDEADVSAALFIAREAGAKITTIFGDEIDINQPAEFKDGIIISNRSIHSDLICSKN